MKSPIPDYLAEVLDNCGADSGERADHIPQLAAADPDLLGVAVATVSGSLYTAGDTDVEVSIQSVSKPFVYALALCDLGTDAVDAKIDVEPSGDAFNEISLDPRTGRPSNPMINAGAIAANGLVTGNDPGHRFERVLDFVSRLAGRQLVVDEEVYESEMSQVYRNRALANLLRSHDIVSGDPEDALRGYIRQCSILVNCKDLAMMAATLASGGVHPISGERVVGAQVNRRVLSVMTTCGMYDAAGDWMTNVGIPAKSGVSGVLIGALPGQVGVASFSPRLDPHGNSVRGVRIFERLSEDMGMHMMEPPQPGRSVLRSRHRQGDQEVIELEGTVQFSQAEAVVRGLDEQPTDQGTVVFDLSRVYSINDVALKIFREVHQRLLDDGLQVEVRDPDHVYDSAI